MDVYHISFFFSFRSGAMSASEFILFDHLFLPIKQF